ncbi:hypothetical protein SAMD00079811_56160 [Scytonema sp. HK-05]|uniref:SH3 domain-containing protein n=1 Tax=Scytonema sp. HK-05 TaxID=1137095 RepID=UPI000936D99A|nr:SH3 domain-containing protein [Scytonema sp. HK-05]OKH52278.1 hypothetical protein NIES2130_32335 [Scytonema sp. HK-05]BAY47997.1 hypothetical protein SAMD00079811_56160 [Scytonema sp. HK-05]
MNTIEHEPLFTDLTPEQAAILEGGVETYCPYTTQGVTSRLNIRSGPGTQYDVVDHWNPGEVKYLQSPAILSDGFRAFDSSRDQWVSRQYIKPAQGRCLI